ncbi:hypothetical protein ACWEO2_36940 [Nocardia sp. NPDC004278]
MPPTDAFFFIAHHNNAAMGGMKVDPSFRWNPHGTTIKATFEPQRSMGYRKAVDRLRLTTVGETRTEVTVQESLAGPLPTLLFSSDKPRADHDAMLAGGCRRIPDPGGSLTVHPRYLNWIIWR